MPKFNLHLETSQDINLDEIQWNDSLLARTPKFLRKTEKDALNLLLLNISKYRNRRILYSRRNEKLLPDLHNPHRISWKSITGVVDQLGSNGLLDKTLGDVWYSTSPDDRKTSSFVANERLLEIVDSLALEDEITELRRSHIQFKDSVDNHIAYEPTPYTERIEKIMHDISEHTNKQRITLDGESLLPVHHLRQYKDRDGQGKFRFGGRSYPTYCSIPKEDRKRILINGEETASCDYSSSVPSIVYSKMTGTPREQVEMLEAPYEVEGMSRKVAKRIVNILLNSDKSNFRKGVAGHFSNPKTDEIERRDYLEAKSNFGSQSEYLDNMIDAVMIKNKPISQAFLQGASWGQHWSWLEANTVYEVAHYLIKNNDIPLLVLHDEFIVPASEALYIPDYMYTVGLPDEYETNYTSHIFTQEPQDIK